MIYVCGKGNVGTAFARYLRKQNVDFHFIDPRETDFPKKLEKGNVFIAVSDISLFDVCQKITAIKSDGTTLVSFSGIVDMKKFKDVVFLHPYASVNVDSDFSKLKFVLWSEETDSDLEKFLKIINLDFIKKRSFPTEGYHTSAVISGNFMQLFFEAAKELLSLEGFSEKESSQLVDQTYQVKEQDAQTEGKLQAVMDGKISKISVQAGDEVKAGQTLLILEAMKMEHPICTQKDGVIKSVLVQAGEQVKSRQLLIELESE